LGLRVQWESESILSGRIGVTDNNIDRQKGENNDGETQPLHPLLVSHSPDDPAQPGRTRIPTNSNF